MYRYIMDEMALWYEEPERKTLLIKGAYGVGKTWSIKDFSTAFFDDIFIVDLDKDEDFQFAVEGLASDEEIFNLLFERFPGKILAKGIILFDEIQVCTGAVSHLVEFAKRHKEITVCLIQSSIGETVYERNNRDSIYTLYLKPMSFNEYLLANKQPELVDFIENIKTREPDAETKKKIFKYLREYMVVGGMPGIVSEFVKNHNYEKAEKNKNDFIDEFERNIKHNYGSTVSMRARRIIKSLPKQLSQDNKKFKFSLVEENARKREYSAAVDHLSLSGMVIRIENIKSAEMPLYQQINSSNYELYMVDIGLLFTLCHVERPKMKDDYEAVKELYEMLNGGFGEQLVMSELYISSSIGVFYYWTSGATARVPMVVENESGILPVDIRVSSNSKAQNVKVFKEKYGIESYMRISLEDMYYDDYSLNMPVYGISSL